MRAAWPMLSAKDVIYAISMSIGCFLSYWVMTGLLNGLVAKDDDLLGGMWAAIAAVFVFRQDNQGTIAAAAARFAATLVSFVLCLIYLSLASPTAVGMAITLAVGAFVLQVLNRRDEIITMAITTVVVMVVAILSPSNAASQPLLRLVDTVVGISIGMACSWLASLLITRDKS